MSRHTSIRWLTLALGSILSAAMAAEDPAAQSLEHLRAANQARSQLAREEAAWTAERDRLRAVIRATRDENQRHERQAAAAEQTRDAARARRQAVEAAGDLAALRRRLADGAAQLDAGLRALAPTLPPGVISAAAVSGGDAFDAAVRALEAAERAAGTVGIEVVVGERGGRREAVRLLRVGGAAAWWVAVDAASPAAGWARWDAHGLTLIDAAGEDAAAIQAACAQVDGRMAPGVPVLPLGDAP